jgi:hypothetical protein
MKSLFLITTPNSSALLKSISDQICTLLNRGARQVLRRPIASTKLVIPGLDRKPSPTPGGMPKFMAQDCQ